ncbi:MAG: LysM peptidoglycan-binding domain-containing protein [bacterium]|nr:LysM peptidoglycan-binding domain-containing protein [bacterium]
MAQTISDRIGNITATREKHWYKRLISMQNRKKIVRYGLVAVNLLIIAGVIGLVTSESGTSGVTSTSISSVSSDDKITNPLDEVSSADVAVHIANVTNLPESIAVKNNAEARAASINVSSVDNVVAIKPQVIATGLSSRADIIAHVVVKGEDVGDLAEKYGITSDTIKWSNELTGNDLSVGDTIYISPVDGLLYKVKSNDTIGSIVSTFQSNKEKFIAINDLEAGNLPVGERVIIPDGKKPAAVQTTYSAYRSTSSGFAFGSTAIYGYNGYDPGWCTWYAASRVNVPTNWGNANAWDEGGRASGWIVSSVPVVGAIAQSNVGWAGHVAIVEEVSPDGKMIKYSDMNGLAGWGRVGYSGWVPANSKYENFIYR